MATRTFVALDLDELIRRRLDELPGRIGSGDDKIRWVDRGQFHLTLQFLGDVDDADLNEVCRRVSAASAEVEPFEFHLHGAICVPPAGRRLRMIWAGVDDPTGRLALLGEKISAALGGMGLREEERSFRPHVTLARIKFVRSAGRVRREAADFAETDFGTQHAEETVVYGSELTDRGPIHTPVARAALGG